MPKTWVNYRDIFLVNLLLSTVWDPRWHLLYSRSISDRSDDMSVICWLEKKNCRTFLCTLINENYSQNNILILWTYEFSSSAYFRSDHYRNVRRPWWAQVPKNTSNETYCDYWSRPFFFFKNIKHSMISRTSS